MARPKKRKNKELPPNLYYDPRYNGRYYYRRPDNGKEIALGKDRQQAVDAARGANARLIGNKKLIAVIMGTDDLTLGNMIKAFTLEKIDDNPLKLAKGTLANKRYRLNRFAVDQGHTLTEDMTTKWAADYLKDNFVSDSYKQHRIVLLELCQFGRNNGWLESNPVQPTDKSYKPKAVMRKRLNMDQFNAIFDIADKWFQIAMELAFVTCHGRAEVAKMKYSDIKEGTLYIVREKTQQYDTAYIAAGQSDQLKDIIKRSREIGPELTPFIVHRVPQREAKNKKSKKAHWSCVEPVMLTRTFRKLALQIPSLAKLDSTHEMPTFHEIRSLGSRELKNAGAAIEDVQHLMGHANPKQTELYQSRYQQDWITAQCSNIDFRTL